MLGLIPVLVLLDVGLGSTSGLDGPWGVSNPCPLAALRLLSCSSRRRAISASISSYGSSTSPWRR